MSQDYSPFGEPTSARPPGTSDGASMKLSRWLVYFASGEDWVRVGEYVAFSSDAAIERAIEIFGCASDYRAEEIPWDALPFGPGVRSGGR